MHNLRGVIRAGTRKLFVLPGSIRTHDIMVVGREISQTQKRMFKQGRMLRHFKLNSACRSSILPFLKIRFCF